MAYCPNCGTEYEALPLRCQCGYLFGQGHIAPPETISTAAAFDYQGSSSHLLLLYLKLIGLSIVTLGIYSFWGRTEIRRYLWGQIRFASQPFGYHGTGKEMFLGWLLFVGGLICVYTVLGALAMALGREGALAVGLLYVGALGLIAPYAMHGAIRYRWSRTSWAGRRFAYRGDFLQFASILWLGVVLSVVTLSLYLPIFLTQLRKHVVENTWFGGQPFQFEGEGKELLWPWAKCLLLLLPTLGIYRFWFQAETNRYHWMRTRFVEVPFRSTVDGGSLFLLTVTNYLLTVFTLGIGYPWAVSRKLSYLTENLKLESLPRIQLLEQRLDETSAVGDVLGGTLGTDAGIDAGFGL
jgi:uncharacterized membrane protein YjgN (DUF898 family)